MARSSMGGIRDIATGRSDVFMIDPRLLKVKEGWNARNLKDADNREHVLRLKASIAKHGVKQPLTVYWEDREPVVSDGHCRHEAVMMCLEEGIEIVSVPVRTGGRGESESDRILDQFIRNSGKSLSPIEQARAIKRLLDLGWADARVAEELNLSVQWVGELLRLHAAPEDVKDMVRGGEVSASVAIKARRSGKTEELREAVQKARQSGRKRVTAKDMAAPKEDPIRAAFIAGWDACMGAGVDEQVGDALDAWRQHAH